MDEKHGFVEIVKALHIWGVAAVVGSMARAFTALHDGLRNGRRLLVEIAFGAVLGGVGAGVYAHLEPALTMNAATWLKIAAMGAAAGGMGPVVVTAAAAWINRRAEK